MIIFNDIAQNSEEWFKIKAGVPSASDFDRIITTHGKPSKSQTDYAYQLAGESIIGIREESYQSVAMQWGIEKEEDARKFYEFLTGNKVIQVGFCMHDSKICGCSPDGLVGDDGGVEIKCPKLKTHVGYLLDNIIPSEYYTQVQGSLYVTGRKWWDFISYYPKLKPLIIRVFPDIDFKVALEVELNLFSQKLTKIIERIK